MSPQSSKSSSSSRTTSRSLVNAESGILSQVSRVRAPRRAASNASSLPAQASKSAPRPHGVINANGPLGSGKVDTNLRSYDRRDPFTAIATLIKLFKSLPSRVITGGGGGCQYKLLTVEEHKLCMHLCNIVEPFILSSVSHCDEIGATNAGVPFRRRVLLMRQPAEILDRIASYIVDRGDLMNFGLSCKRLSEVVFPRHWEYRIIRAKVSMIGVWKHLCERSDLAENVRVVEVIDERSDKRVLVPKICRKAIVGAIPKTGLPGPGPGIKAEEVASATSTEEDSSSASGSETRTSTVGAAVKKVSFHRRQEKYFIAALGSMFGLLRLKWEANHSPMSVLDDDSGMIWRTVAKRCGSLETIEVADNMSFSPLVQDEEDAEENPGADSHPQKSALVNLRSISLRTTQFPYGAPKEPSMNRISAILHQCPNVEHLEIVFKSPKTSTTPLPVANEFLVCGRWSSLTSLTLTNLSCFTTMTTSHSQLSPVSGSSTTTSLIPNNPLQTFLSAHPNLEVLKLVDMAPVSQFRRLRAPLSPNTLPKLKELHASKDIVNMILRGSCDPPRPLEVIKGFKLAGSSGITANSDEKGAPTSGSNPNLEFYQNLKKVCGSVRRVEMEGWGDLEDIKMLALCLPKLTWLDVGRRLRFANCTSSTTSVNTGSLSATPGAGSLRGQAQAPVTNMVEWAEVLSNFEELMTFHGVKFFYEISPNALPNGGILPANDASTGSSNLPLLHTNNLHANISMTDRSRIKKNDGIAGVLAWKCPKLKRVDHWENVGPTGGKVIVLCRDSDFAPNGGEGNVNKVRWDVRRVRG